MCHQVAVVLQPLADFMIASEAFAPAVGWNYRSLVQLMAAPEAPTDEIMRGAVYTSVSQVLPTGFKCSAAYLLSTQTIGNRHRHWQPVLHRWQWQF